jgi:quercetin dioxygenase-like cupin family protein
MIQYLGRRLPVTFLGTALLLAPVTALSEEVPDALSVEWEGKKPCEKLYEDPHNRMARCVFPPGAVHVRHSHPGYISYVLSGGKGLVEDEKGKREVEVKTGASIELPPVPCHEFTNIGDTTLQYLIVEKKYQPVPR